MEPKNGTAGIKTFRHEDVLNTLFLLEDYFLRASLPYAVVGKLLQLMVDNTMLDCNKIELGIKKRDISEHSIDILRMLTNDLKYYPNKQITFTQSEIPIEITIFEGGCFDTFDEIRYLYDVFKTPNPIKEYLKTL